MEQVLKYKVKTYKNGTIFDNIEDIVEEKHYELFIDGKKYSNIICSPFNLNEMIVGFLWMNGIIEKKEDILKINFIEDKIINVNLLNSIKEEELILEKIESNVSILDIEVCKKIDMLESRAKLFQKTGGVHCAAIIDIDNLIVYMEDIGRHNTLDKIAGYCLLNDISMKDKIIAFSGRLPYEIVFKTIKMKVPIIISISAPTSLGIDYAKRYGVTLCGFTRKDKYHIYTNDFRVIKTNISRD